MTGILKKGVFGASFPLFVFVLQATAAGGTAACGDSGTCMTVRDSTYQSLETWQGCDPGKPDQCIVEPGNPKDCTGVLTCSFAINPLYRAQAEGQLLVMGEQSNTCYLCATPTCGNGATAYCEPVSKRCMLDSTSFAAPEAGVADSGSALVLGDAGAE